MHKYRNQILESRHNPTAADLQNLSCPWGYHNERDDIDSRNTGNLIGKVPPGSRLFELPSAGLARSWYQMPQEQWTGGARRWRNTGGSGWWCIRCGCSLVPGQRAAWLTPTAQRSPASAGRSGKQGRSWPVSCGSECRSPKPEEMGWDQCWPLLPSQGWT